MAKEDKKEFAFGPYCGEHCGTLRHKKLLDHCPACHAIIREKKERDAHRD